MNDFVHTRTAKPSDDHHDLERQVAGALSLMLPVAAATSIVRAAISESGADDRLEISRAVVSPALWQHRRMRWSRRIKLPVAHDDREPPLGPQTGVTSTGAVALALHLGADLDQDELSDVLSLAPGKVAGILFQARMDLLRLNNPCDQPPTTLLGFYKAETFDLAERMQLHEHLRSCPPCRHLIGRFESLDIDLAKKSADRALGPDTSNSAGTLPSGKADWFAPLAAVTVTVALFLGLGGLLIGVDRVLGGSSSPVPLVPEQEETDLHGWLVSSTVDGIAALNLGTGEHRTLLQPQLDSSQPPVIMMSPTGDKVALWRFHEDHRITTSVDIISIDGRTLQTWRWDRTSSPGQISSWLSDDELLFIRVPGQGPDESTEDFVDRMSRENELLALNVFGGQQRTLYTGSVAAVIPSPDREYMVILGTYNRFSATLPGRTLEIRPIVDGVLGDAIVTDSERHPLQNTRPIWADDSSAVFYGRLTDDSTGTANDTQRDEQIDLAMATVDGHTQIIRENPERGRIRLLGVSPDREALLYLKSNDSPGDVSWNLHRVWIEPGVDEMLASSIAYPFFFSASATWLPDGKTAIVNDSQTHYVHGQTSTRSVKAGATRFLSIGEDRPVESIATELGLWGVDAWGEPTLRWFPDDWLDSPKDPESRKIIGVFSVPETVEIVGNDRHTNSSSSVSPGGDFALFEHTSIGVPLVWSTARSNGRLLAGSPSAQDVSWTPGNPALVGVRNDPENGGQITLFASRTSRVADFFDYRGADPLELDTDSTQRYASPMFSSDGNYLAFFVTDEERGRTSLWISSYSDGHQRVLDWQVPEDALINPHLNSAWTSRTTLLVAVPDSWEDGYPTETRLVEVNVQPESDDAFTADTIYRFTGRGGDRGTTLESLDFNPNMYLVAVRLRSYTSGDPERGQRDAVIVASTADVTQSITIARGDPGNGLSWSPDGEWISFAIDDRIVVSRHDGSDLQILSEPEQAGRYPLWLPSGDLYYTEGRENAPRLMRVSTR
jgi:hypothetical protein